MILLRLFYEFFKTGLFSVGGGMATIPFLQHMGEATGWFTNQELTTMIAVSESTPGPMGVNMATYVGFHIGSTFGMGGLGGIVGAVVATLGLITPSIIVILIIAGFLQKFRHSRTVEAVFSGLRPHRRRRPECGLLCVHRGRQPLSRQLPGHLLAVPPVGCGGLCWHEVDAPEEAPPHRVHPGLRRGGHPAPAVSPPSGQAHIQTKQERGIP